MNDLRLRALATLVACLWCLGVCLDSGKAQTVEASPVGSWSPDFFSGEVAGIAISGQYAYVAAGPGGLHIIDISDPGTLVRIKTVPITAYDVTLGGEYAYVACGCMGSGGVEVMNIQNPTNPVPTGRVITDSAPRSVAVSGNYAYAAIGRSLGIIEISNPSAPVQIDPTNVYPSGMLTKVSIHGNHAYGAAESGGCPVIDIGDPTNPVFVTNFIESANSLAIAGNYLYVATRSYYTNGLEVFDLSNPANPASVGLFLAVPGNGITGVTVSGTNAYLVRSKSLEVVDISNPTNLVSVGTVSTTNLIGVTSSSVVAAGDYVYTGLSGLWIFAVTNLSNPVPAGHFLTVNAPVSRLAAADGYACLLDEYNGLQIISVSNLANPVRVGGLARQSWYDWPRDVAVSGDYVCMLGNDRAVRVVNISDPANPVLMGTCQITNNGTVPKRIAASGHYAFVGHDNSYSVGLSVVDFSKPSDPEIVAEYWVPSLYDILQFELTGMVMVSNTIYLSCSGWAMNFEFGPETHGAVHDIDVSDPTQPADTNWWWGDVYLYQINSLAIAGDHAYLTWFTQPAYSNPGGSNRSGSAVVGTWNFSGFLRSYTNLSFYGAVAYGNYLFADKVYDISNRTNPVPAAAWGGQPDAVEGDLLYVANGGLGIWSLRPLLLSETLGNQLLVKWGAAASDYVLEGTTNLGSPQWSTVGGPTAISNSLYRVTVPATNPAAYFRLRSVVGP